MLFARMTQEGLVQRTTRAAGAALSALAVAVGLTGSAAAAPPGGGYGGYEALTPAQTPLQRAEAALGRQDYQGALLTLEAATAREPQNPDIHNLIGFSNRKLGRLDAAGAAYETALRLDPLHKGALEYQGEMFLMQGDLAAAEANLARLAALCPSGCAERDMLARAIAAQRGGA